MKSSVKTEFSRLVKQLRKMHDDVDMVRNAFRCANTAHQSQFRLSGEPYVTHSIAVARILANLGLDPVTVSAALLHDVLEDTPVTFDEIEQQFGQEISLLVDGVTKIGALSMASTVPSREEEQAINLRKMLIATASDVRVILIKLADRLHNMRTIEYLPPEKIERISKETLDVYTPLAHRLGIWRWKWELEDHAFHRLQPKEYREIVNMVAMKRREREADLNETVSFLEKRLAIAEVTARVMGRPKHLYSIYQKMVRQGKSFDQVTDILALRIITQTVSGCYNALGEVHSVWKPIPGRFKDYIALPKENMYQSIHTSVMRDNGRPLEVQIRTEEMDSTARQGIAAHWRYKEGKTDHKLDNSLEWLRHMYDWLQDAHAPDEVLDSLRLDLKSTDIYIFTPRGEVKELPLGATPLDFAYKIHSDIGNHCIGARVNGHMVPLRYNLQMGDMIEILTAKHQHPHRDWVDIVVTGRARTRIRHELRELGELDPVEPQEKTQSEVATRRRQVRKPSRVKQVTESARQQMIRVEGGKGIEVQFGKCCNPMPGEAVLGYVTLNSGITVHRIDCKNFASTLRDKSRIVEASWEGDKAFETGLRILLTQRPNILADITNAVRPLNISIVRANFHPGENGESLFDIVFEASDNDSVERVTRMIEGVAGVKRVKSHSVKQKAAAH